MRAWPARHPGQFQGIFSNSICSNNRQPTPTCKMMEGIIHGSGEAPPPAPPSDGPAPPPPPPEDSAAPPPPPADDVVPAPPPPPADEDLQPAPPPEAKRKKKQGWGSGAKKPASTPLSVEELVRKKREADAAAAKVFPIFFFSLFWSYIMVLKGRWANGCVFCSRNSCLKLSGRGLRWRRDRRR